MTRRRWLLLVAPLVIAGSVAAVWPTRRPRPCRETFERVRVGMTREEVIAVVGGPPGDYSNGTALPFNESLRTVDYESWYALDACLEVRFDDGRASEHIVVEKTMTIPEPALWWRLRRRLGL